MASLQEAVVKGLAADRGLFYAADYSVSSPRIL